MLRYQKNEHNKRYDEKICQGKMRYEDTLRRIVIDFEGVLSIDMMKFMECNLLIIMKLGDENSTCNVMMWFYRVTHVGTPTAIRLSSNYY